jgi:hypothetical protein
VASPGTRHASVASLRRTTLPEHPTPRNLAAPPPAESENKPAGSANTVAEHNFEGDGFWTVVEEEVPPVLTLGVDPDPILGDPDNIWEGPQDLEPRFTWDVPDDWLCEEAVEIKEEEREGTEPKLPGCTNEVLPLCNTSLPQGALNVTAGPEAALVASLVQRVAGGDAPKEEES